MSGVLSWNEFRLLDLPHGTELTRDQFNEIQSLHDEDNPPAEKQVSFKGLADKYGLTIPVPE
ncbi:hypothetical protein [Mesorhizobium sp. M7A.F.Ca.MR.362.00.0.0]|uniref:hypothetical protein n=1 Tax=Mesorhizobium sp. M7A.F.Ca.MR.362.00.0.0 TaxID=2496779 RepID=UPI000FD1A790|nr:hypothetical protein [Mesorhizobium sp. M7A.F.Ca.MR.362.00.0.0]RUU78229.1 hypothetical protein EOC06_20655 [Mesorhizobium sp. M7A.F.Ca.MR.362.00.0.0]